MIFRTLPPALFSRLLHTTKLNQRLPGRPNTTSGTGGMVTWRSVTPDYFRALKIPIVEGRNFTEAERSGSDHLVILSKLLASRLFPQGDAPEEVIGKRMRPSPDGPFYTVIGIAANVKNGGLTSGDDPEYYRLRRNLPEDWHSQAILIAETSLPSATIAPLIRAEIGRIDPTLPAEVETLSDRVGRLEDRPRFATALVALFAFTGLAMAVIGLYGLTAFLTSRRTQELGVRMALGADRGDILRLIAWDGTRLILVGGALGVVGALAVTQLLGSLLFQVGPRDPAIFLLVALMLALVTLVAILIPARAATRIDPVAALRRE